MNGNDRWASVICCSGEQVYTGMAGRYCIEVGTADIPDGVELPSFGCHGKPPEGRQSMVRPCIHDF